jgi:hypothetical protein
LGRFLLVAFFLWRGGREGVTERGRDEKKPEEGFAMNNEQ